DRGDLHHHGRDHARRRRERTGDHGHPDGVAVFPERGAVDLRGEEAGAARQGGGLVMTATRSARRPAAAPRPAPAAAPRHAAGRTAPLVAVHVRNPDTVAGRFRGAELEEGWRITSGRSTADELRLSLAAMFRTGASGAASVLSSVVPPLTRPWLDALRATT